MRRNFFSVFATVQAEVINILVLHGQFDPVIINNMTSVNNYSNRELQQITKDNMDRELSYQNITYIPEPVSRTQKVEDVHLS